MELSHCACPRLAGSPRPCHRRKDSGWQRPSSPYPLCGLGPVSWPLCGLFPGLGNGIITTPASPAVHKPREADTGQRSRALAPTPVPGQRHGAHSQEMAGRVSLDLNRTGHASGYFPLFPPTCHPCPDLGAPAPLVPPSHVPPRLGLPAPGTRALPPRAASSFLLLPLSGSTL